MVTTKGLNSVLQVFEDIPAGFLEAKPDQLHEVLGGPALIHLRGRREPTLFVSSLLHGNEWSGVLALQSLLRKHRNQELPRSCSIFIGNVSAAREGLRCLEHQPDFNRIWPGSALVHSPEQKMMAQVEEIMVERGLFASIDVHNNTGLNPHYACVNKLDNPFLQLAILFSRTVVYFTRPLGVQSLAFAKHCPSVTIECGHTGQSRGTQHAEQFIEDCLHMMELPDHPIPEQDISLFHTVAIIKLPSNISFGFETGSTDVSFAEDLDHLNFRELSPGTRLARVRPGSDVRLLAWDNRGREVGDHYFDYQDNEILLSRPVMPSMLTLNEQIIRQDCLCYLMERHRMPEAATPEALPSHNPL